MTTVGVAAGSDLGAEAGAAVARAGGNAVDACLAAAVMGWVSEPLLASPGGSAFVVVQAPAGEVEVIDGNAAMPYSGPDIPGEGLKRIFLPEYSNGIFMGIGGGSVALPGALAAVRCAWERHGRIEWAALFTAAIRAARVGIPFPRTSAYYATATWDGLWSGYPEAVATFGGEGRPLLADELLVQPQLAEALEAIASQGPRVLYEGEIGRDLVAAVESDGGFVTLEDLGRYRAEVRRPITETAFGWTIYSNPPPSVGGIVLMHMLKLLERDDLSGARTRLEAIVSAQRIAIGHRLKHYGDPASVAGAVETLLRRLRSESTTHYSAADADGSACALTQSIGYGAGLSVHGILLNNALGEEELNPGGPHRLEPGSRCLSNMAPTIASGAGRTVALGSPGADRIVTAVAQTLLRLAHDGESLEAAVGAARAHLEFRDEGDRLCVEPGLPAHGLGIPVLAYTEPHMYFGAVQCAEVTASGQVFAQHDPRRSGGERVVGKASRHG